MSVLTLQGFFFLLYFSSANNIINRDRNVFLVLTVHGVCGVFVLMLTMQGAAY